MRLAYLLLHDFRFASMGIQEFTSSRFHFSKEYAKRMAEAGHEVVLYVLTNDRPRTATVHIDGYELKAFRTRVEFPPFIRFGNDHSLEVLKELRRDSPDLIHLHNYYLWNFFYTAPWARRSAPFVAQYHGTDPIHGLKGFAFRPSLRLCDRLLVPVRAEERFLVERLRIPRAKVKSFPSTGVDTNAFRQVADKDESPLLTYAGRIPRRPNYRWEKAPQLLLPVMKSLLVKGSKARLIIAGDGPGLADMKDDAGRLGISDRVDFLGEVDHEKLIGLYSRSWLTFSPMLMDDIEPFWGGTVQESLACGTPVAAINPNSTGFRQYGLLLPPEPHRAAEILGDALAQTDRLLDQGKKGLEYVRMHCDWTEVVSGLNRIYGSLLR